MINNNVTLNSISTESKHDKELIMSAVKHNASTIQYLSPELACDKELLFFATANFPAQDMKYFKHAIALNKEGFFNPPDDIKEITNDLSPLSRFIIYAEHAIRTTPPSIQSNIDLNI